MTDKQKAPDEPPSLITVLGLVAMVMLLLAAVAISLSYATQLSTYKKQIQIVCLQRIARDAAADERLTTEQRGLRLLAEYERTNRFIDNTLRQKRIGVYLSIADADQHVLENKVKNACQP